MIYTHMKLWDENGTTWHSLKRIVPGAGCTDLSMGPTCARDVDGLIAWATAQRLIIEDRRAA